MLISQYINIYFSFYSATPNESQDSSPSQPITDEAYKQVVELLQLVTASCRRCSHTSALFMDELSSLIATAGVDPKVEVS